MFALTFHKNTFQERIDINKDAVQTLHLLSEARHAAKFSHQDLSAQQETTVYNEITITEDLTPHKEAKNKGFGHRAAQVMGAAIGLDMHSFTPRKPTDGPIEIDDVENKAEAKIFATHLYKCLIKIRPLNSPKVEGLLLMDFLPFFSARKDAEYAFGLFDRNSSGKVSRFEFKETVVEIFEEKLGLEKSLLNSSQAIGEQLILDLTGIERCYSRNRMQRNSISSCLCS